MTYKLKNKTQKYIPHPEGAIRGYNREVVRINNLLEGYNKKLLSLREELPLLNNVEEQEKKLQEYYKTLERLNKIKDYNYRLKRTHPRNFIKL